MFLFHYILPLIIFYFHRSEIMLFGLLLGNLIDLDHVYLRITKEIPWLQSACSNLGEQCSFGIYPLHNIYVFAIFTIIGISLLFFRNKYLKLVGIILLGASLNLALDYFCLLTGIGF